jgi:CheY-like chemotaxis protein
MRVMIVEDETLIRLELMHRISRLNHEVVASVGSGEESVDLAEREAPDLIFMDVQLSGELDGVEALRRISRFHSCRMTILTAYTPAQLTAFGDLPDGTTIYSKPIADPALHAILANDEEV